MQEIRKILIVGRGFSNTEEARAKMQWEDYDMIITTKDNCNLSDDINFTVINVDTHGEKNKPYPNKRNVFLFDCFNRRVNAFNRGYREFFPINTEYRTNLFCGLAGIDYAINAYCPEVVVCFGMDFGDNYFLENMQKAAVNGFTPHKSLSDFNLEFHMTLCFLFLLAEHNGCKLITLSPSFNAYFKKAKKEIKRRGTLLSINSGNKSLQTL